MLNLIKILIFGLIVMLGFTGFTRFGIPMIIPAAPPVEEKLSGDITMPQFIALGGKIFEGKGTCTLCHNSLGRAPMLEGVATIAAERMADSRYAEKGKATDSAGYIYESMVDPSAYVVVGFGKTGTNDTVSPMPDVSKGSIGLSEAEINAVIAYLQDLAGQEPTVPLPTGDEGAPAEEAAPVEVKLAENAAEAFTKFECGMCHMHPAIEEGGDMGPDLGAIGATAGQRKPGMSAEQFITESIINPNAAIAEGFEGDMMPDDYSQRLTVAELNLIVNAILGKDEPNAGGQE